VAWCPGWPLPYANHWFSRDYLGLVAGAPFSAHLLLRDYLGLLAVAPKQTAMLKPVITRDTFRVPRPGCLCVFPVTINTRLPILAESPGIPGLSVMGCRLETACFVYGCCPQPPLRSCAVGQGRARRVSWRGVYPAMVSFRSWAEGSIKCTHLRLLTRQYNNTL